MRRANSAVIRHFFPCSGESFLVDGRTIHVMLVGTALKLKLSKVSACLNLIKFKSLKLFLQGTLSMKLNLALLALFSISLMGCGQKEIPPIEKWITFKSPTSGYSLLMPKEPIKQTQTNEGITVDIYISEANKEFAVVTTSYNLPDKGDLNNKELVEVTLDATVNGTVDSMKSGKLLDQKKILLAGKYPGREFTGTFDTPGIGKSLIRGRVVLTDKALLSVGVAGIESNMKIPQVLKCLESLKFE